MTSWSDFKARLQFRRPMATALNPLRYLGPGMLVAVGFIDPGNWASNVAAGAGFGYQILWVVSLGTLMLILLQHNAAHLGIATGLCLAEGATRHLPKWLSRPVLGTAVIAAIATAFAEILGGAISLQMLFHIPLKLGACLTALVVGCLLLWNTYKVIEKIIVGFVSLIGLGFLFELLLVKIHWASAATGWVMPHFPSGSTTIIMSVLGAVVMPHNLFLHSEFIQSRQWNQQGEAAIQTHLRFELFDTLFSMIVGWAINSAMILLAAATFFRQHIAVDSLEQAESMLRPILGPSAALVFAMALLCAGLASSTTAGMAGGSIFAGIFDRPYDIKDPRSKAGVGITLGLALLGALLITDTFKALILSQVALSIQLPITILLQVYLTSSRKVMGTHANGPLDRSLLWITAAVVISLNLLLLRSVLG
ncbi:MAG: divalent metal cation transporter [Holophagaceae bacterium]|nr:divalent metal cation transporter [Holophagaceae bacterium]